MEKMKKKKCWEAGWGRRRQAGDPRAPLLKLLLCRTREFPPGQGSMSKPI